MIRGGGGVYGARIAIDEKHHLSITWADKKRDEEREEEEEEGEERNYRVGRKEKMIRGGWVGHGAIEGEQRAVNFRESRSLFAADWSRIFDPRSRVQRYTRRTVCTHIKG